MPETTDAVEIGETKPHLSWTQLSMLTRCGEQYNQRYINKRRCPPGIALIVGGAVHKPVEADLQNKIDYGELLPDEQIPDLARDAFESRWNSAGEILLSEEEATAGGVKARGAAIDLSISLASLHHSEIAPGLFPSHVERKFVLNVANFPYDLLGYIDVQESRQGPHYAFPNPLDITVRDTKTAGKSPSQNDVDTSGQLTLYAMAVRQLDGVAPDAVWFDSLVKTKTPKAVSMSSTRTDEDFRGFLLRMERACEAIQKGVFLPADPSEWICSPRWCGYYDGCPFGRRKRVQI